MDSFNRKKPGDIIPSDDNPQKSAELHALSKSDDNPQKSPELHVLPQSDDNPPKSPEPHVLPRSDGDPQKSHAPQLPEELEQEFLAQMFRSCPVQEKKSGCFNYVLAFCLVVLALTVFLLFRGLNFIKNDLLSAEPLKPTAITLSGEEEADLQRQREEYQKALLQCGEEQMEQDMEFRLTRGQITALLSEAKTLREDIFIPLIEFCPMKEGKAQIFFSFSYSNTRYLNVILEGTPVVSDYRFEMEVDSVQVGRLNKSSIMREKIYDRINRGLREIPRKLALPFKIKSLHVEGEQAVVSITLAPNLIRGEATEYSDSNK